MSEINAQSIAAALAEKLDSLSATVDTQEVSHVDEVGDGIARVSGLRGAMAGELLEFVHAQVFEIPRTFNKVQYAHSFASRFLRILPVKTGAAGACA